MSQTKGRLCARAAPLWIAAFLAACGVAHAANSAGDVPCPGEAASAVAPPGAGGDACGGSRTPIRRGMRLSNHPSDGRTGGTPETSARVPGGPPDDIHTGLTVTIPSVNVFSR